MSPINWKGAMMARTVSDIMTKNPLTIEADEPVYEAARQMRSGNAGDVIVLDKGNISGILTDRDIAIRVVADQGDPATPVRDVCSGDLETVSPDTSISAATKLMRDKAVRRLPVVQDGTPVGVISIGDLAMEKDEGSALADNSAAPPNT